MFVRSGRQHEVAGPGPTAGAPEVGHDLPVLLCCDALQRHHEVLRVGVAEHRNGLLRAVSRTEDTGPDCAVPSGRPVVKATAWIDNLVVVGPGEGGRYRVLDGIDVFAAARRFKGRGTKAGILCCSDDSLGLAGVPLVEDKHGAGAPGDDDKCHGHGWRDGPPGAGP